MTGTDLVKIYGFSFGAINRNLTDVTEEESLVSPPLGGNSLNWVLGHIVVYRGTVLRLAGEEPVCSDVEAVPYRRGATPSAGDKLLDMATLRGYLEDSQQRLLPALAAMSEEKLSQPVPESMRGGPLNGSVGDGLMRLQFHESYHAGQLGLLRRVAGKDGAIR